MANKKDRKSKKPDKKTNFSSYWFYAILIVVLLGVNTVMSVISRPKEITMLKFEEIALSNDFEKVEVINRDYVNVYLKKDSLGKYPDLKSNNKLSNSLSLNTPNYTMQLGSMEGFESRIQSLAEQGIMIDVIHQKKVNWVSSVLSWMLPLILFIGIWLFIMRRVSGGGGGPGAQIFNIGKSRATLFDNNANVQITFADVAGLDEAKEEVMEIVDFLKNPKKYTSLGGKIPKGVILVGPPGTGKTLLAKAVAGEAGVPFSQFLGQTLLRCLWVLELQGLEIFLDKLEKKLLVSYL